MKNIWKSCLLKTGKKSSLSNLREGPKDTSTKGSEVSTLLQTVDGCKQAIRKKGKQFQLSVWHWSQTYPATQVKLYSGRKTHNGKLSVMNCPPQSPNLYILDKPLYSWRNEGSIWLRTEETLANFQSVFLPHMQHFHVCLHMLMSKNLCTYFVF